MKISPIVKFGLSESFKFAIGGGIVGITFSFFTSADDLFILFIIGFTGFLMINMSNQIINASRLKKIPFLLLLISRTVIYLIIILITLFSIVYITYYLEDGISLGPAIERYYYRNMVATHDFIYGMSYAVISAFVFTFFTQLNLLVGRGKILKYISGRYHKPIEDERILMFLDISSSTTIAEKIGHLKYSSFIKDFIYELNDAIIIAEAEIIQYVGDELLIMWNMKKGIKNNNCVNLYFLAEEQINRKKQNFIDKYGVYPQFKSGLHAGKMIIMEVGTLKKEISHYGDSMNTAARIRSTCNEVHKDLLISDTLLEKLDLGPEYKVEHLGPFVLKGKEEKVSLSAIERQKAL